MSQGGIQGALPFDTTGPGGPLPGNVNNPTPGPGSVYIGTQPNNLMISMAGMPTPQFGGPAQQPVSGPVASTPYQGVSQHAGISSGMAGHSLGQQLHGSMSSSAMPTQQKQPWMMPGPTVNPPGPTFNPVGPTPPQEPPIPGLPENPIMVQPTMPPDQGLQTPTDGGQSTQPPLMIGMASPSHTMDPGFVANPYIDQLDSTGNKGGGLGIAQAVPNSLAVPQ